MKSLGHLSPFSSTFIPSNFIIALSSRRMTLHHRSLGKNGGGIEHLILQMELWVDQDAWKKEKLTFGSTILFSWTRAHNAVCCHSLVLSYAAVFDLVLFCQPDIFAWFTEQAREICHIFHSSRYFGSFLSVWQRKQMKNCWRTDEYDILQCHCFHFDRRK